jgi:acyl-CoA reductase-like NAD-dependent aldehyde dehydrogenase
MKIINPANHLVIADIPTDTSETVHDAYLKLKAGQRLWAKQPIEERIGCIEKFGELINKHQEELAEILTSETGKVKKQALSEIRGAQNRIDFIKKFAAKSLQPEIVLDSDKMQECIVYEPLGVIGNISAWNYPYNVGFNVYLFALIAGNAVLYKPSELASLTGLKMTELLHTAGVPKDVFACVIGDSLVGEAMLREDLDGYYFTGSYATGKYIAQRVAEKLVPVQLELGGKDPLYVMEDIPNIVEAAQNAAEGAFYNAGQSCCSVERIYVHEKIYNAFVEAFVEEVATYNMGDPTDLNTFIGPLTRPQQVDFILDQVEDAVKKGARLKLGGKKIGIKGNFLEPTVLSNVNHKMKVMREESFGPVIGIQSVKNDAEALAFMQDTSYGLTAAIFSSSHERAQKMFEQLNVGTVYWNCCDRVSPYLPWSGRKNSGLGATLSISGIRAFTQPKAYQIKK